MGLRDQIAAAADLPIVEAPVPEWPGVRCFVCRAPASRRDALEDLYAITREEGGNGGTFLVKLVAMTLCEEDGTLVYDVEKESDLAEVARKSPHALRSIAKAALKVNGMSTEEDDAVLVEKSEAAPVSVSATG